MTGSRTLLPLAALAAIMALFSAGRGHANGIETIDCHAELNRAEQTICKSQKLQILDAKVTEVYADAMLGQRLSERVKQMLRYSQYGFLARRNACGPDPDCLEDVMTQRANRIRYDH